MALDVVEKPFYQTSATLHVGADLGCNLHCPGFLSSFPCERRKPGWEKATTFCDHRVRQSSFRSAGMSSSLNPKAKRRPQLVLEQGLEAFPSMCVMQGSSSAALIPVPPRNCSHLGTCLKYMSTPTYCTGLPQSIPLKQHQQP